MQSLALMLGVFTTATDANAGSFEDLYNFQVDQHGMYTLMAGAAVNKFCFDLIKPTLFINVLKCSCPEKTLTHA